MKKNIYLNKINTSSKSKLTLFFLILMFGTNTINAQIAPGNVSSELKTWYKASVGITGDPVSQWDDQSGNDHHVDQSTASYQPTTGGLMNFNPALTFDGSNDRLEFGGSRFIATDAAGTMFGAATNSTTGSYQNLAVLGSDHPHMGVGPNSGDWSALLYNAGFNWHPTDMNANQPYVFDYFWNGGNALNAGGGVRLDGLEETSASMHSLSIGGSTFKWTIGSYPGAEPWNGMIGEIILYDRNLTSTEKDQVDTYLGIKYGTTLSHNYLAGDGSTIYDVSTYGNDVAGIGREDGQGLAQKQSMSVNSGNQPAIAIGDQTAGFPATVAANSSSFSADDSYMIWGNNGQSESYATSYTPNSYTPASAYLIMDAIWHVEETGTIGTVTVRAPAGAKHLIVHNSNDFTSGTPNEIVLDANGLATVDLTDGQYFTFGQEVTAPGCVSSNLLTWYKADIGVTGSSNASAWADQSGNGNDIAQSTSTYQPATGGMINFNPALTFDGSNDRLEFGGSRFIANDAAGTMFGAASNSTTGGYQNLAVLGSNHPHMGVGPNGGDWSALLYNAGFNWHPTDMNANQPYVFDYFWNGGNALNAGGGTRLDGLEETSASMHSLSIGGSTFKWTVGSYPGAEPWNGMIGEIILYDRNLSSTEKDKVDSYLGIKYGTTLSHNYLAGDGGTVYDVSTYGNNVTGIARDDCQDLSQKQSKSVNSASIITIGIDTTITTDNASHSGAFDNTDEFVVFGDNGATGWTSASFSGPCHIPESLNNLSDQKWKLQETGDAKSVRLQLPDSYFSGNVDATNYPVYLIYADDEALNTNRVSVQGTVDGSNIIFDADFPANSTVYFSFAGTNSVSACTNCTGDAQYVSAAAAYGYGCSGANQTSNSVTGVASTGGAADISTDFSVTFPTDVTEFIDQCWPRRYGDWLQMIRYDNTTGASGEVLFEASFDKSTKPSFDIASVDYFIWQQDEIEIIGYDCSGNVVPDAYRTSLKYPAAESYGSLLGTVDTTANGGEGRENYIFYASPFWKWGTLNVEFTKAVDKVEVKWRQKSRRFNFKYFQYLYIGPMTLDCPFVPSCPTDENIYVNMSTDKPSYSTCDTATLYLKLKNLGCDPQIIDLQNVLPSGVNYLEGSLNTDQLVSAGGTAGSANAYGGTSSFNWTGFTLPVGEVTVPIQFYASSGVSSTAQADFQISGGDTGQSDNSNANGCQATPINFTAETPPVLPEVAISTDETCYDPSGQLNYTITIDNTSGGALSPINFSIPLSLDFTIVNSSVVYSNASMTSDVNFMTNTADEGGLIQMDNLTIPSGTSTIEFTANANTSDTTATPSVIITGDITTSCGAAAEKIVSDTIEHSADPNATTCETDSDGDGIVDSAEAPGEENDPCLPVQSSSYNGYDSSNTTWQSADCDGDGVSNTQEVADGSDPYDPLSFLDADGDGVADNGGDADAADPCIPAQSSGYTGFDSLNVIWRAGNCDGDSDTNGAEADAGADPYCDQSTVSNPTMNCDCNAGSAAPILNQN